jgi:hypothetical protein
MKLKLKTKKLKPKTKYKRKPKKKTRKENPKRKPKNHIPENNILFFSSFIFITNAITAYYKNDIPYCILFASLTATSLTVHTNDNFYTNTLDKIVIGSIFLYGAYRLINKISPETHLFTLFLIVLTFLSNILLYLYGYYSNQFCFHPQKYIADQYHYYLHVLGSIGHHLIMQL